MAINRFGYEEVILYLNSELFPAPELGAGGVVIGNGLGIWGWGTSPTEGRSNSSFKPHWGSVLAMSQWCSVPPHSSATAALLLSALDIEISCEVLLERIKDSIGKTKQFLTRQLINFKCIQEAKI